MAFKFADQMEHTGTLIVDSLNLCFRWKHLGKNDFKHEFEHTVNSLANSYRCGKIILTADWGSSSYRKELYPEYKADRKERFKNQTPEEKEAFEKFFNEYEETLKLMDEKGYIVLRFKGVEADDIAAHLVNNRKQYELNQIWLISSDRDWDLLINEDVSRFSTVTRKEVTVDNWNTHYDVSREEYISFKCLTGDKGDNIPGITGIGPKRAEQLIKTYGSAFDVYDACPIDSSYVHIQNLNEQFEQIPLNYELMDLVTYADEAIGDENIQDIRGNFDIPW